MAEALQTLTDKVGDITNRMGNMLPNDIREGELTKAIESQTAKIPSVAYLNMAIGSIALSLGLAVFSRNKGTANFVGQWVPTFLLLGIYNKLVKLEGSDKQTKNPEQSAKKMMSSVADTVPSAGLGTTAHGSQGTIKKAAF